MDGKTRNLLFVMLACVCMLVFVQSAALAWWGDKTITPTSTGGSAWATATDCGTYWWVLGRLADCTTRGQTKTFDCNFGWGGRGSIHLDYVGCASKSATNNRLNYRNTADGLTGVYNMFDGCAHSCAWYTILDTTTADLSNYNGIQVNADQSATSGCGTNCGVAPTATREIHMWGDKYVYLNKWTCLGGYASADVTQTTGRSFPWGEAGLYLYPAVETGYGNVINTDLGYGGHVIGAVATGDCGAAVANSLDFKGNANAYGGGDNMDSYGMAWVNCSSAAAPQFKFGSDDGNRVWVDGTLKFTDNTAHGMSYDAFTIASTSLAAGWHRILFKIHNGTSGFEGTMSLRNGSDADQNEPNVALQTDRTLGSSVSGEQDAWYPRIDVAAFEGTTDPQPAAAVYTNETTINANGTDSISSGCPVPFWKVMHFEWGYGLTGNTNFANVSGTPTGTSWSHVQTGVTGHRRFHFFAVSHSGRTSYQTDGDTGGWTFADGGAANYMDVYVDNVAPAAPSLSSVTVVSPNRVDLAWGIPLDQGVGIANGSDEAADATTSNYYRRGDVGVNVRRNGASAYGWGAGTSLSDTGLTSNTQYTYDIAARDNTGSGRGAWQNTTGYVGSTAVYTLADAPTSGANITAPTAGSYTAAAWPGVTSGSFGTGSGLVTKFMYKWSASSTDSITEGQGTNWSTGTMTNLPGSSGTWYLYVRSYNGATVGNGSTKFGPYDIQYDAIAPTVTNVTVTPENVGAGGDCLKGELWVYADAEDNTGGSGLDTVEVMLTDGSWAPMTLKSGTTYEKEFTIDASSVNGARTASVRAKDLVGNITDPVVTQGYTVNKNEVSGEIALQGFTNNSTSRAVTFVLNGTISKPVTLTFVGGKVGYSFTDVPEITSISAKTAWTLRKKLSVTPVNGQSDMDFTGSYPLLGGDLNGDNAVNALDYSALRSAWGQFSTGDITGDGWTNNADYLMLKSDWYKKGEAQ